VTSRIAICAMCMLAACGTAPDTRNTLKSLETQRVAVERDTAVAASREKAALAYQKFIEAAPRDRMRPEAMRRLGDLEIERADEQSAEGSTKNEYRGAIKAYEDLLNRYPAQAGNDRVLYQLAHAYDVAGDTHRALVTLDRLAAKYPDSAHRDEAEFRRGEILFTLKRYSQAEDAYGEVLKKGEASTYHERALYMHGWSLFKQVELEKALESFFAVLDRKLIGRDTGTSLEEMPNLTRADRELLEDTFRVVSLSLANLNGPGSIPKYFAVSARRSYEFHVYEQLGELYFKQERVEDGAETFNAFARLHPTHVQAPVFQSRVIRAYQEAGFASMALQAKSEFVTRYGVASEFRRVNGDDIYQRRVAPHVRAHLEELARHYHATAQKSKKMDDYAEAARWYRAFLTSFPDHPQAPALNFLLAELLFESKQFAYAAREYERAAYEYERHPKSADAGYAALLAYAEYEKSVRSEDVLLVKRQGVDSALRFAEANPKDARVASVLTNTAEKLYAVHDPDSAMAVAKHVLALEPPPAPDLRRIAWTVTAHVEFQQGAFDRSENAYSEVLALTPEKAPNRSALTERLAASIYKQGEQARSGGNSRKAVEHFLRVGRVVPDSPIRVNAEYDAAAMLIVLKEWNRAGVVLEDFRRRYPKHPLQAEVPGKLAVVYLESGQALKAASEFETLAASKKDAAFSRDALWQAAELYEKAGKETLALSAYERYVAQHSVSFETAIEARYRVAEINRKQGNDVKYRKWLRELLDAEQKGGSARTDRTRYLGAISALATVDPLEQSYRSVRLVEPLKKNLRLKKERMEKVLNAYSLAAEYGSADVATTATYRTAALYQDFGKALMDSQRPKGLSADELEQYNVLLEEEAYPFEEKAIEIHEINVRRVQKGLYDDWVRKSFIALAKLRPVRYAKAEKGEGALNALH
jgi:TolA-binding protein